MGTINWSKVHGLFEALAEMNADETEAVWFLFKSFNEFRTPTAAQAARPAARSAAKTRRPYPKGDHKCVLCHRRLDNAHGLKIHMGRAHKNGELFPKEG